MGVDDRLRGVGNCISGSLGVELGTLGGVNIVEAMSINGMSVLGTENEVRNRVTEGAGPSGRLFRTVSVLDTIVGVRRTRRLVRARKIRAFGGCISHLHGGGAGTTGSLV